MASPHDVELAFRTELDRPTLVVGNIQSLAEIFPEISQELEQCSHIRLCGELPEDDPATELWQRIEAWSPERIWIVGGDGTINLAGQCAIRSPFNLPCWLTPAGTANDLSRALSEHNNLSTTSRASPRTTDLVSPLLHPEIKLDLLRVVHDNNPWAKCAANMLTMGASARNTQHVTPEIKSRWGALAYLTQLWRAIGDLEPFTVKLTVGRGEPRVVSNIVNIFVANGPFCGGGFRLAPLAQVDDGLLDVVIIRLGTTGELATVVTSFLAGSHLEHPLVEHFTTTNLTVECTEPSPLTLDGEALSATKLDIQVLPGRLPISLVTTD